MNDASEQKAFNEELDIADVLIERPLGFSFNRKHYNLYPLCIGTMQLLSRFLTKHGLDRIKETTELYLKLLMVLKEDFDSCLRILAYMTLKGDECLDEEIVSKRCR